MKKHHRYITVIISLCAMLALIFDSKTALAGAAEGIELCTRTVIPSLFPMMVLSGILTDHIYLKTHLPNKYLDIPNGSEGILLAGLMGGYPVGAACIAQELKAGKLSTKEANHLLRFCNNAGPAFIFGVCGHYFSTVSELWLLWLIHVTSAIMIGLMLYNPPVSSHTVTERRSRSITKILACSVRNMSLICGWILLFRVLICFIQQWIMWLFPSCISVVLSGALELTIGCTMLDQISSEQVRFIICSMFLGFGGFCVYLQTAAVADGLSMSEYLKGKLLQTTFSFMLSYVISSILCSDIHYLHKILLSSLLFVVSPIVIAFFKKAIAFFAVMRYNTAKYSERGNGHAIS